MKKTLFFLLLTLALSSCAQEPPNEINGGWFMASKVNGVWQMYLTSKPDTFAKRSPCVKKIEYRPDCRIWVTLDSFCPDEKAAIIQFSKTIVLKP